LSSQPDIYFSEFHMTALALPAQDTAIQNLSQDLFGDRWYVSDTYQHEPWTREEATLVLELLHQVEKHRTFTGGQLRKEEKVDLLGRLMRGEEIAPPVVDPPVDQLIPEPDLASLRKALDEPPIDLNGLSDHDTDAVKTAIEDLGYRRYVPHTKPDAQPEEETLPGRKPRELKPIDNHGTASGYTRHRSRGEEACPECVEAKRAYDRAAYQRREHRKGARPNAQKPDLKATTKPRGKPRTPAKKPNGAWVQTDEGRGIARVETAIANGDNPIRRYLNLLLTLAESQPTPDPALLDRIGQLIDAAL
jgi:hypothetical protein